VDEERPLHELQALERLDQEGDVVPVERAEVLEAQLLEQHAGDQNAAHPLERAAGELPRALADPRDLPHDVPDLGFETLVGRGRQKPRQVLRERPDVLRDRHAVVVDDDHQVPLEVSRLVQALEGEPGRE
jgi:hypothetical protein